MLRTVMKIIAATAVLGFAAIQFVRPDRTNPPIDPSKTIEAVSEVPADVAGILDRSCIDCHSNRTRWPWYSNVAPVSWSVADHVTEAREELNFSEWGSYSEERRARKLEEICEEVEEREMPHPQYLWLHREAVLSETDIRRLCDWTEKMSGPSGRDE